MPVSFGTKSMIAAVLHGSLIVSAILTLTLLCSGLVYDEFAYDRIVICSLVVALLIIGEVLLKHNRPLMVGVILMVLYAALCIDIILLRSINAPTGLLLIGLVIFLSGVLLGTKHIIWVTACMVLLLVAVHHIHYQGMIQPSIQELSNPSDSYNLLSYIVILSIFALLSWMYGRESESSLQKARLAEEKLLAEKNSLAIKLEKESSKLREAQLKEMMRLYSFAEIGQSTTATLHELSNLLSVLTLDINNLGQLHRRSKAIMNAEEGINNINQLVRQTRRQLHDTRKAEVLNAVLIIDQTLNAMQQKYEHHKVILTKQIPISKTFFILGDKLNLSHTLTVLLNNSLDACITTDSAEVAVKASIASNALTITIKDNGPGIPADKLKRLFKPHESTKPSGLGIGLYVTKHIIESQFQGKIEVIPCSSGACFKIQLPRYTKLVKASSKNK
jgi:signal transduction histidine kinase